MDERIKKQDKLAPLVFLISGAITATPFIFPKLWLIPWFSLSVVIYYLMKRGEYITKRRAYILGLCLGAGYFLVMYHWFAYLYPMEFAGLTPTASVAVIALCWIGLAALQAFEMGFLTLFYRILRPSSRKPWLCAVTFTALWVTYEWQQTLGWRGVPWGRLALSQSEVLPLIQSASLFGSMFVSALIIAVNACVACAVFSHRSVKGSECGEADNLKKKLEVLKALPSSVSSVLKKEKAVRIFSVTAAALFFLNALFGGARLCVYDETEGEPIIAAAIQGNISSTDKWADNSVTNASDIYISLTRECVEATGAKLVVWPETVIATSIGNSPKLKAKLQALAEELDIVLAVGAFDVVYNDETNDYETYNALFFFESDGTVNETVYYKRRLVPFGESLPMEGFIKSFLPILLELNLISEPLAEGSEASIVQTEFGNIGSLICFDSIYQSLTWDSVSEGAELFVLATNDSWFSDSAAIRQHKNQAAFRAIESGRYFVRAANTGISAIIASNGEVLTELEPLVDGYAAATIYVRSDSTLYDIIGDIFAYVCVAYIGLFLAYRCFKPLLRYIKALRGFTSGDY